VIWDSLLEGLGAILAFFYQLIPSYGVAIILLTVLVRLVLLPLTIRQTRSMQEMQKLQPKVKELQRKYKGNRQKLNEEMMKLYKEHQVNPLGGCLPLVLQLPVFFALFWVLTRAFPAAAVLPEPVPESRIREGTVCRPDTAPSVSGARPQSVICTSPSGASEEFAVTGWETVRERQETAPDPALALCRPEAADGEVDRFVCEARAGTRYIPRDSGLFAAIVEDRTQFLGMRLSCSPTQAASEEQIELCAGPGTRGGIVPAIPYFVMVALMVGTTYYQQKQMQRASAGPAAQQQQLMGRIMPVFLGFISISISAGVLVYWVTTNAWQIGQQHLMLRRRAQETPTVTGTVKDSPKSESRTPEKSGGTPKSPKSVQGDGSKARGSGGRGAGSRKKRRKR
jgi:YidC/Oxa1 family membrane protein insertase